MFFRKYLFMKPLFEADGGQGGGGNGAGAAGAGEPGEGGTGASSDDGKGDKGEEGAGGDKSFDDVLKDKKYQSEFDKRVTKALETAKLKWDAEAQKKIDDAATEAQKLAKMTADQKADYEKQKRENELTKREKDITVRELKAQAYETLAEKGLPKELVDILNYESADTCNKSIEAVEKAFQVAVEKAVNEKLRGNPPKGGSGGGGTLQETIAKAMRGQI